MVGVVAVEKDSGSDDEPPSSKDGSDPKPEPGVTLDPTLSRTQDTQGATLEEMPERSGLTPNYIGGVEKGDVSPSAFTALATGSGPPDGESLEGEPILSAAAQPFDQPPPGVREAIVMILRAFAKWRRTQAASRT